MTETLLPIVQKINGYLSDYILVALLIAVGLWYSIKTRFVQVRHFKEGWNSVFGSLSLRGGKQESGMSSFQALATAIAAQVGTGNIVGASGAILTGGPGAIFWMWVIAFLGMATIYAEATLAQETRTVDKDGNVLGGPVYYITTAFKGGFGKFLAGFFAVAIILALGFFGCMVQSNSIGETFSNAFNVPTWIIGVVLVAICGFIFLGGVQRLASVTEKIVPIMAAVFLAGGLIVLIARIKYVPATFGMIFRYAFAPQAIIGGGFGAALKIALSQGAKRGLFSNEAGMGSTPHAHAQANVKNPHQQGVVAMIGVFIDTFVRPHPQRPRHHLHPLHRGRPAPRLRRGCGAGRAQEDQPCPDRLRRRLRRERGRDVRRGLPVLLRFLHHSRLEPLRQDQHGLPLRSEVHGRLHRHRAGVYLPRHADLQRPRVGAERYVQ